MAKGAIIIGAGGHAKVVIGILKACGEAILGILDDDATKWGQELLGVPILGPISLLDKDPPAQAIIAIGNNQTRKQVAERAAEVGWMTLVHPAAWVDRHAQLDVGTVVCAGAVIQPQARLGRHVIVNTSASVDHDCVLSDYAQVGPGAHLAGAVVLGEGVMMGTGSVAIPSVKIGDWTTIGAGAVVIRDLPAGITAVGVPARVKSDSYE
ncbi:MAG: acetyltransferase [Candidatus Brachytrichaceae bacterium NZ_4S206]|jgi:sugar O-acyltransferase (sialic acid O-acetyltransferase NeuD family)